MISLPRMFCITLECTPFRKAEAEKHFLDLGLKVEFFEGIDGESLGVKPSSPNYEEIPGKPVYLTNGNAGCILSHLMLWKTLQFQPEEEFIIFEDDVILDNNFKKKFNVCYNELPKDWEFVYIGYLSFGGEVPKKISENIGIYGPSGTHAYMVKKSALSKLIKTNIHLRCPIDYQIRLNSLPILKNYIFLNSLVSQKSVLNTKDLMWRSLCYNWDLDVYNLNRKLHSEFISFGSGWYQLENNAHGHFIWSNGESRIFIDSKIKKIEFEVQSISYGWISIGKDDVFSDIEVTEGDNKISIDLNNNKYIDIHSDIFIPSIKFGNLDSRTLGVSVKDGFKLTFDDRIIDCNLEDFLIK